MKDLIIYHRVDLDGVCSAAIVANKVASEDGQYDLLGWSYGDPLPEFKGRPNRIWVLDISFGDGQEELFREWREKGISLVWIDHHETAIKQFEPEDKSLAAPGIRRVGTAACVLTWEYVHPGIVANGLVNFLGTYDVWDKDQYPWGTVLAIQYSMRTKVGLDVEVMRSVLANFKENDIFSYIPEGQAIIAANSMRNESDCQSFSFEGYVDGYSAIFMNTLEFNSTTFKSVYNKDRHYVMVPFAIQPNGLVRFSLYTERDDVHCGNVAKIFGGGGHAKAADFLIEADSEMFMDFLKTKEIKK